NRQRHCTAAAADRVGARPRALAQRASDQRRARRRDRPDQCDRRARSAAAHGAGDRRRHRRQRAAGGARDAARGARADQSPAWRRPPPPGRSRTPAAPHAGCARGAASVRREAPAGVEGRVASPNPRSPYSYTYTYSYTYPKVRIAYEYVYEYGLEVRLGAQRAGRWREARHQRESAHAQLWELG